MSDFDVLDDGMMNRRLSDADIEALIDGASVPCAPTPLTELLAVLRQRAAEVPNVAVSGALSEFIVGSAPTLPPVASSETPRRAAVATRRPTSLLAKAVSVFGLVPASFLIGATVAAAAVGGAQMLGIVDVPFLPDRHHQVETPVPSEPAPPASVSPANTVPPTSEPTPSTAGPGGNTSTPTPDSPASADLPPVSERPDDQRPGSAEPVLPTHGPATHVPTTPVGPAPGARPTVPATPGPPVTPGSQESGPRPVPPTTGADHGATPVGGIPSPGAGQPADPGTGAPNAPPTTPAENVEQGRTPGR